MAHIEQCKRCYHDFVSCVHNNNDEGLCQNYTRPIDNSNMFSSFLNWKGRYSRKQYILAVLLAVALYFALIFSVAPAYLFFMTLSSSPLVCTIVYGLAVALIPSYILVVAGLKRVHDIAGPKIWAWMPVIALWWTNWILVLVAGACFIILIKDKGMEGVNEYGSNPAEPYEQQLEFEA